MWKLLNTTENDITIETLGGQVIEAGEAFPIEGTYTKAEIRANAEIAGLVADGDMAIDRCENEDESLAILKAFDYDYMEDVMRMDYSICGLFKEPSAYDKGRKTESNYYFDEEKTILCVKKTFQDVYDQGVFTGIDVTHDWYKNDGTVGMTKAEFKPLSMYEASKLLRKRRERAVDSLSIDAIGTPAETLMPGILDWYKNEISEFIAMGNTALEDAINAEADQDMIDDLNTVMYNDPQVTVKERILSQIT